jgi:tRNA(fMet)-specific endonuclease VapC
VRFLLDTNRYVDFCRGDRQVGERAQEAERIYLPFVTLAELRAGFLCGAKPRRNELVLTRFLNSPRVRVLYADDQTTHHYGRLFHQLREQGTPIPTNDLWIAALALQHDLPLYARDHHFDHIPQLVRL